MTRLRNGRMPFQQIIGDANPGPPTHWLKRRCDRGTCRLINSHHEDNPVLYDHAARDWTEAGRIYLEKLDCLTGVRYLRLRKGLWVAAEGVIYDCWDPAVHLEDRFRVPPDWTRYWAVDFGFDNPFCWQCWAEDPDGGLHLVREIYRRQRLVEDLAGDILAACGWRATGTGLVQVSADADPLPRAIICDHDAEDRATLERHLHRRTVAAYKGVKAGIQAVQARLRVGPNGKPRIRLFRDALCHPRDADLDERRLPCCTAEEVESYVWDPGGALGPKDLPIKRDDHGMDTLRYLVAHLDRLGEVRVEDAGALNISPVQRIATVRAAGREEHDYRWQPQTESGRAPQPRRLPTR